MACRRSSISALRSFFYVLAKLWGDVSAASKSPEAMAKRLARRQAERITSRMVRWRPVSRGTLGHHADLNYLSGD
jgi:hypothetical protein